MSRGRQADYAYCVTGFPDAADPGAEPRSGPELGRARRVASERRGLRVPEAAAGGQGERLGPVKDEIPAEVWRNLLGSAAKQVDILTGCSFIADERQSILRAVADRARAGVQVRICAAAAGATASPGLAEVRAAFSAPLLRRGAVEVRQSRTAFYHSIYRADHEPLVAQHAFGIPSARAPVLHLRRAPHGGLLATYLDALERLWLGGARS